jgi:hypothetical protein
MDSPLSPSFSVSACPNHALWVIGDIHGRYQSFTHAYHLFKVAKAQDPDLQLIILGDVVDRGPDSLKCFQFLSTIRKAHPSTVFILGNHEQFMYGTFTTNRGEWQSHCSSNTWFRNGGEWALTQLDEVQKQLTVFPESFWQSHYISGDVLCVHASIDVDMTAEETTAFFSEDALFHLPAEVGENSTASHPCWKRGDFIASDKPSEHYFVCHGHSAYAFDGYPREGRVNLDGSGGNATVCAHVTPGKITMHSLLNTWEEPTTEFPTSVQEIVTAIGIPQSHWSGNCHTVALKIMARFPVKGMRYARGHWRGVTGGPFKGRPFTGHTWLQLSDGRIVDPTRFVFENVAPYIYIGPKDSSYDEGGIRTKARTLPAISEGDLAITESESSSLRAQGLLTSNNTLSLQGAQWLGHTPLNAPEALANFTLLQRLNLKVLVPLDCWQVVMEPEKQAATRGPHGWYSIALPEVTHKEILLFALNAFVLHWESDQFTEDELAAAIDTFVQHDLDFLTSHQAYILGIGLDEACSDNAHQVEISIRSQGWTIEDFDRALITLGNHGDLSLGWL